MSCPAGCWLAERYLNRPCWEGVSMLLNTPEITRDDNWSCGRVALEVMIGFHQVPIPQEYRDLASPVRGLSDEVAESIVRKLVPNLVLGHWTLDVLEDFIRRKRPVMVLVTNDAAADHWVCVRGFHGGRVHYHDTAGRASKSRTEFARWWAGPEANDLRNFALCGWPT